MKKNMIQLIIASIFLFGFISLLYIVWTKKIERLDIDIYEHISKLINQNNTKIMKCITFLGSTMGIILGIFISFFFLKNNFDRLFLGLGILGEVAINNLIKVLVKRMRPTINPLVLETSYSFPSGHTMAVTAFYGLVLFFIWKSPLPILWKGLITFISALIVLAVAFSRVYLGVHYSSDVIAAICCSLSYVLIITYFYIDLRKFFF